MSGIEEYRLEEKEKNKVRPGRPRLTSEEALTKYEEKREKAKERYYLNKETCYEQSKKNSKRIHEFYKVMKELIKDGLINLPEDRAEKIKELLLLS